MTDQQPETETPPSQEKPKTAKTPPSDTKGPRGGGAGKAAAKAATAKKGATSAARGAAKAKRAGASAPGGRANTKQAKLIAMLRVPEGTTIEQAAKAFGWQPHTVRGAIYGALKKKLGLKVESEKIEGRGRVYRIGS
ncbi:MAG: DUF3489 domain-containing protein [Bauldia sp.]